MKNRTLKKRPAHVELARVTDNLEQLRASGKKGAKVTNQIKADKAEAAWYYREQEVAKADQEAARSAEESREHIAPIDPEKEDA